MTFEMMDAEDWDGQSFAQRVGEGSANQQRAGETWALGIANSPQIPRAASGFAEDLAGKGHQSLDMIARGELGHHAAVNVVHCHLRMNGVAEELASSAVIQRDAGF